MSYNSLDFTNNLECVSSIYPVVVLGPQWQCFQGPPVCHQVQKWHQCRYQMVSPGTELEPGQEKATIREAWAERVFLQDHFRNHVIIHTSMSGNIYIVLHLCSILCKMPITNKSFTLFQREIIYCIDWEIFLDYNYSQIEKKNVSTIILKMQCQCFHRSDMMFPYPTTCGISWILPIIHDNLIILLDN